MVLLRTIQSELDLINIDDVPDPEENTTQFDVTVGRIEDDDLKKLNLLLRQKHEEIKQKITELETLTNDKSDEEQDESTCEVCKKATEINRLNETYKLIDKLFWNSLRAQLTEEDYRKYNDGKFDSIGIRKDWDIVLTKPDPREKIGNLIRNLIFGGLPSNMGVTVISGNDLSSLFKPEGSGNDHEDEDEEIW